MIYRLYSPFFIASCHHAKDVVMSNPKDGAIFSLLGRLAKS